MCRPDQVQCRPSCTNSASDLGFTVILLIVIGAAIASIGPVVGLVSHMIADIVKYTVIGAGSGLLLAAITFIAVHSLRARALNGHAPSIHLTARQQPSRISIQQAPISQQRCITCGDKGRIIRVGGNGDSFQIRACPDCQPAQLAG